MRIKSFLVFGFTAMLFSASALAQETTVADTARQFERPAPPGEPGWQGSLNLGYDGESTAKFQGAHLGDSGALNLNAEATRRFTLNDLWFLNLGLASDNVFLNEVGGAPVPDGIHTLRLSGGAGFRLDEQWTIVGLFSPSLYRFDHLRDDDVGFSGGVTATFRQKPSLIWTFGLLVSPDSDIKVFPIIGVHWMIDDHYTLDVGIPKTRLTYRIDPKWSIYGGLDLIGTSFRTGEGFGPALAQYNNAAASYRDIRLGVGAGYQIVRGIRGEVETGFSVYREIDYFRIDQNVKFNPAPYVRLGLNVRL
jgi:hypothetical protein